MPDAHKRFRYVTNVALTNVTVTITTLIKFRVVTGCGMGVFMPSEGSTAKEIH